ncbi:MAG: hypothetical protein ACI4VH_05400 [Clostridia bacterium]
MNESKRVADIINYYINDNNLLENLVKQNKTLMEIKNDISEVIKYFIMTRDTELNLDIEDIIGRSLAIQNRRDGYYKENEFIKYEYDIKKIKENTNVNGFVTHSFNAYIKNKVKQKGLRNDNTKDKQLGEDLLYLESKIGRNKYLDNQDYSNSNEIYIAAPGQASVHYATNMNPERLYLGPLSQERNSALPIKIGESKNSYLMRVAMKKAQQCPEAEQIDVIKCFKRVIDKLANDTACIGLIPMKSDNYEMQVAYSSGDPENRKYTTLEQYYSPMALNGLYLSNSFGNSGQLNDGVTTGKTIPGKDIGIIDVPDEYTIVQMIAKEKGLEFGTYIDYFTGQKIDNYQSKSSDNSQKDEGTFLDKMIKQTNLRTRTGMLNITAREIKSSFRDRAKQKDSMNEEISK